MSTEENISPSPVVAEPEFGPGTAAPAQLAPVLPINPVTPMAVTGQSNYTFMPTSLDEAVKLAQFLAKSTIVPKHFADNPANCFVAMQWGAEIGLRPLQALQNIAVINNRPGLFGDAGKALLLANGCQIQEDDGETVRQQGYARCTITRRGRAPVSRTFSLEDARAAKLLEKDGPWKQYPYRQLAWRAFWFAARDAAADILRGMAGVEELADYQPAETVQHTPRVEVPKPKAKPATKPAEPEGVTKGPLPHESAPPAETPVPASPAMLKHVHKLLERAALSTSDVAKKFPEIPESLEGINVNQVNAIMAWIANPTE